MKAIQNFKTCSNIFLLLMIFIFESCSSKGVIDRTSMGKRPRREARQVFSGVKTYIISEIKNDFFSIIAYLP